MKKLMFGLAALVAATSFAAIESANIVGYAAKETNNGGNTMLGASFVQVSSKDGAFSLADLKVTGYDVEEGTWGDCVVTVLSRGGTAAKDSQDRTMKYYWYDCEDVDEAGWYDGNGVEKWDAENIIFKAGQGFWVQGEGLSIQTAGQVTLTDIAITTSNGGNTPIANPFATTITLADISVSGYDVEEGTWGDCVVTVLSRGGTAAKDSQDRTMKYFWYDCEDVETAGWYDGNGVEKWEDTISFPIGQGFWVQGEGLTIQLTNPIVK